MHMNTLAKASQGLRVSFQALSLFACLKRRSRVCLVLAHAFKSGGRVLAQGQPYLQS